MNAGQHMAEAERLLGVIKQECETEEPMSTKDLTMMLVLSTMAEAHAQLACARSGHEVL